MDRPLSSAPTAVLCALAEELGGLAARAVRRSERHGVRLLELDLDGAPVLAAVGGVGKVRAAQAAALLAAEGVGRLLVVGVGGGLRPGLAPGDLVHCQRAIQGDLYLAEGRETRPDAELLAAWEGVARGRRGVFVTRDRAAVMPWRRVWLARRFGGAVADMETAAAAAVAERAGLPWAALRAVTDGLWWGGLTAFRRHFPTQAGRAADTVPELLAALAGAGGARDGEPIPVGGSSPPL